MKGNGGNGGATALLLGLPETGKTTFLAALWHVVNSNEVSGSLSLSALEGDREHLNAICKTWQRFEKMERTLPPSERYVRMRLVADAGSAGVELVIPDMSGESVEMFLERRQWPIAFDDFAHNVEGFLLFVHPDLIREGVTIDEATAAFQALGGQRADTADESPADKPYDPSSMIPTQVQLVDLMQLIAGREATPRRRKVAVIISAWDIVREADKRPGTWLERRLPLLSQFLRANVDLFDARIYGVSAQGGNLPDDRELLARVQVQSDRIAVTDEETTSHDITAPLRWLLLDRL